MDKAPENMMVQANLVFAQAQTFAQLENEKAIFLGKEGWITQALKGLAKLPLEEKKQKGAALNVIKTSIEASLAKHRRRLEEEEINKRLSADAIDVSLPGRRRHTGSLHPNSHTRMMVEDIFTKMGFTIADGPEIELDDLNFTALNIPANHPARSMQDTFFLQGESQVLLRTHTSPVQIRYMRSHTPPIRIIAPGRVYRVDSDATHSPMFQQIEGLWVDRDINFGHLKGVVAHFLRSYFSAPNLKLRCRPSFFPFTEPSAEFDMTCVFCEDEQGKSQGCKTCSHTGWIEIGGSGMVHPSVLTAGGIDPQIYQGWAFGMGLDRLSMLKYGVNDLRLFYENDHRFLAQF